VLSAGGSTSGGSGGAATGGESGSGTAGVGASAAGGAPSGGRGGVAGMSGSGSGGSSAGSGGGGAGQTAGCGKTRTLQNGTITIMFNNASRKYILRAPDDYDSDHPYRLVFAYAESGASATSVADRNYFTMAALDTDKTTIFVAPDAANGMGSWSKSDVDLTDAILAELEADLCIDKTRIFATGFSFGGAMSLAIACQRADVFRGVAFFSGADLTGSCTEPLTKPIAYYASQASEDSTGDPMPTSGRVKQAEFAAVNGCTAEPSATTFPAAGEPHTCTIYKNCSEGHPTVYCVFEGPHGWEPRDPGQSMSWNAPEAWKFITQF
jgi:poly(3-hydroxybutyrate) depolymerase